METCPEHGYKQLCLSCIRIVRRQAERERWLWALGGTAWLNVVSSLQEAPYHFKELGPVR